MLGGLQGDTQLFIIIYRLTFNPKSIGQKTQLLKPACTILLPPSAKEMDAGTWPSPRTRQWSWCVKNSSSVPL